MSRLAQKLCDEIVEPAIQSSRESNMKSRTRHHSRCYTKQPSQCSSQRARSVIIEKSVTSKIYPSDRNANQSKIEEQLVKKNFNSKAANTDITGPLRTDTDCLTMVQKRSNKCSCKCIQKRMSNKMIQKLNNLNILQSDKACIYSVKTVSCGTQFSDKFIESSINLKSSENRQSSEYRQSSENRQNCESRQSNENRPYCAEARSRGSRPVFYDFMGARRWALSQYQIHGPDF